jgi:hypothetical protein
MSDDLDGYEPAIEPTSNNAEASVESAPSGKVASAAAAAEAAAQADGAPAEPKIGTPPGEDDPAAGPEPGPRRQRVWTGKSRALFQQLAAKGGVGAGSGADDLVPMEHAPAATPAPAPAAAAPATAPAPTTEPSKQPVAAPTPAAAPVTPPPGLPDLPDLPLPADPAAAPAAAGPDPKHAEREAALAAREAALVEREKLLPDRRALVEKPADAMIAWLADTYGITDPTELKTAVADLITEMSASPKGLGIGVPGEHMAGAQSRRATRVVSTYSRDVDQRERALREREAKQAKDAEAERGKQTAAQQEAAYVSQIGERLTAAKDQFPFLHDADLTNGQKPERVVYEVMREQGKQARAWADANPGKPVPSEMKPSLATATAFAEKFYRSQAEAIAKVASRHQSRLAPATPPAGQPAKPAAPAPAAVASPGGAPGPAPTPAAKPDPTSTRDPSELPDKRSSRAATLAKLRARAGNQPNT